MDINLWITYYNENRSHSGRYCFGKTPLQTFENSISIAQQKNTQQLFLQTSNFNSPNKAEIDNAGEQPIRNSLTDGNEKAVDQNSTTLLSKSFLSYMS